MIVGPPREGVRRPRRRHMCHTDIRAARRELGELWGLDRPLSYSELGRVLRLGGLRPDNSVRDYERGKTPVSGPISVALELLLAGAKPGHFAECLRQK